MVKLKKETFWFHEILSAAFQEVIAVSNEEDHVLMTSKIFGKMAHQNGIDLITAFLSDHTLKGFQENLKLLSKSERMEVFKNFVDFCLAKMSPFATAGI